VVSGAAGSGELEQMRWLAVDDNWLFKWLHRALVAIFNHLLQQFVRISYKFARFLPPYQ
jgi:hypothetical protein